MATARLKEVHPILPAHDVATTLRFYVELLGFRQTFGHGSNDYVGVRRDGVELHIQWQAESEFAAGTAGKGWIRFAVDDPDALFEEYKAKGVIREGGSVQDQPWGTREFGLLDPNGNGLTFYRDR